MTETTTVTDAERLELFFALLPFGYQDLDTCVSWIKQAGLEADNFAEYIETAEIPLVADGDPTDICALALDYIASTLPVSEQIRPRVYGNAMCSTFDIDPELAGRILAEVPEEDRDSAWEFCVDFTSAILPDLDEER